MADPSDLTQVLLPAFVLSLSYQCLSVDIAPDKDWGQLGIYPPLSDLNGYFKF